MKITYLHSSLGYPSFILKELLVKDLVLGGEQALVGSDRHTAYQEGNVFGQAAIGREEVAEVSGHCECRPSNLVCNNLVYIST